MNLSSEAISILLKQIDNQECSNANMWLLSVINRILLVEPNYSLKDFQKLLEEEWPDTTETYFSILEDKGEIKKAL